MNLGPDWVKLINNELFLPVGREGLNCPQLKEREGDRSKGPKSIWVFVGSRILVWDMEPGLEHLAACPSLAV
jgi:hypothetical protein